MTMNDNYYETDEFNLRDEVKVCRAQSELDLWLKKYALFITVGLAFIFVLCGLIVKINADKRILAYKQAFSPVYTTPSPKETNDLNISDTPNETDAVSKGTVLLDAGHGGFDPGTEGTVSKIYEKEINLQITLKIEELLKKMGYTVLMTRTDENAVAGTKEEDMAKREEIIQSSGADLFVSIHQNAYGESSVFGPEVYYHKNSEVGDIPAQIIQNKLDVIAGMEKSRGIRPYGHRLTKYLPYSILIECGYLTNPNEEARLISDEYQNELAQAICQGIDQFFTTSYKK